MSTTPVSRTVVLFALPDALPLPLFTINSFLDAGFTNVALIAHPKSTVKQLAEAIGQNSSSTDHSLSHPSTPKVHAQRIDLTSAEAIGIASHNIRAEVGAWDVFVNFSALAETTAPKTTIRGADENDWWEPFERNVRVLHSIARHFFPKMKANAQFLQLSTFGRNGDGQLSIGEDKNSAESVSQTAALEVIRYLEKENTGTGLRVLDGPVDLVHGFSYDTYMSFVAPLKEDASQRVDRSVNTDVH